MAGITSLQTVQIQTSSACNGKCLFCPYTTSWYKKNPGKMGLGVYNKIIDAIAEYDPEFAGKFCPYLCNEPFTDSRIVPLMKVAIDKLHHPFLELSTNLALPDKRKINDTLRVFEENNWNGRLMVSFHGITKKFYEHNMGLDYDTALENLKYLIKQADGRLNIWIHTAVGSHDGVLKLANEPTLKQTWNETLKGLPLQNIVVYPLKVHNRSGNVKMEGWKYDKVVRKLGPKHPPFDCPRFYRHLHVIHTGEVILCCNDYNRETVVGDLKRQTIQEIYTSPEWKQIRSMARGKSESDENFLCARCQWPGA